ncbi:MAG: carboxypeptidase-like regulatory domain-containing protein, partial [Candidatus Woesebacteria bacterium]|nr:carboxypeptidase-like regulatory domain-containing protein [Candidatus Woesebacteria bacterium]
MKKIISIILSSIVIYIIVSFVGQVNTAYATGLGCATKCSYNCDCSPCAAQDGNYCPPPDGNCCPICVKPTCDGGWENGGCPASCGECEQETTTCPCGNPGSSVTCHRCTGPPPPTNTPVPTLTPTPIPPTSTPTPTPIQPTVVINLPRPSPQAFSKKAITDVQNWLCLQTTPCSTGGCSGGGDSLHRVRITTKTDAKLIANKKTYIFECLETGQGYRCTTGNGTLDQNLTESNYLSSLSSVYGYRFVSLTDIQNKPIQQSFTNQTIVTNNKGDLGPLEWESSTTVQVGRIMMAMQRVLGDDITGRDKSQQLGTFFFDSNYNTTCIMIKWDPHGTVLDINNLKPIKGVKITLLHKNKNNSFDPVKTSDIFNGLENPQVTSNDGKYAFYVPDGTYKLKLEKEGYQPVFDVANINKKVWDVYPQLYDGGEIVTKGKLELRNLAMKKITISDKVLSVFQNIWLKIKNNR